MMCPHKAAAARAVFPRGLEQPEGGFRSGADALLLASFVPSLTPLRFAELGTGCGMAACALLLRLPQACGVGVDCHAPSVLAATRNAARLDVTARFAAHTADVADLKLLRGLCPQPCQVVLANPPYREEGTGRASPHAARQRALCAPPGALDAFCAAACALLEHGGRFCVVFAAGRLGDLLAALERNRLGARRLRCVHTRPHKAARLVLVEARKDCAADLVIEPPCFFS